MKWQRTLPLRKRGLHAETFKGKFWIKRREGPKWVVTHRRDGTDAILTIGEFAKLKDAKAAAKFAATWT